MGLSAKNPVKRFDLVFFASDMRPSEWRDVGEEFGRAIKPNLLALCHGDAEVFRIPVDDDGGQKIEACDAEVLAFRGAVSDFALSARGGPSFSTSLQQRWSQDFGPFIKVGRGVKVDASTIHRWVRKFGPEIAKRSFRHRSWRSLNWHVDETYIRVGGKWRFLWRAVVRTAQMVDFKLTARRDLKAARAFIRPATEKARLYQPRAITPDKAHSHARVIAEMNRFELPGEGVQHINRKWENNRIESDHAALRKLLTTMRGFKTLSLAKATLQGVEAILTIRKCQVHNKLSGVTGEICFIENLFGLAVLC